MNYFIFIPLIFLLIIDVYFFQSNNNYFQKIIFGFPILKYTYWVLSVTVYFILFYHSYDYQNESKFVNIKPFIFSLIFVIYISKFVGLFPLIIDDTIRFFKFCFNFFQTENNTLDVSRLKFLKNSSLIITASIFSLLTYGMFINRYRFKINTQTIKIKDWPEILNDFKIVHISDLHLGSFESKDKLEEAIEIINSQSPDLILFTGDLVNNSYTEVLPYKKSLQKLNSKYGNFSVLGNHDYGDYIGIKRDSEQWKSNFKNLINLKKECGFNLLMNDSIEIKSKGHSFNLVGVENWGAGNFNKDGDIDKAIENINLKVPTILMSHDPSHWREIILEYKYPIDLQLSGHTHGMQFGIEIPNFKWSPAKYRYKEWAGLYKINNKQIYVNRGLGHLGYTGRVGILPDISVLKIKNEI